MRQWRMQLIARWVHTMRKFIHESYQKPYDQISTHKLEEMFESFTTNKTLYKYLNHIIYGFLIPQLDKVDEIRYRKQIRFFALDACESDIPHKLGPQEYNNKKIVLDASTNRVVCDYGFQLGPTKFLEKSGESFQKIYALQLAKIIVDNMRYARHHDGIMQINLSTDMGTEHNPNNIRNILLSGIKRRLKIPDKRKKWKNKTTNITYHFDTFHINVK